METADPFLVLAFFRCRKRATIHPLWRCRYATGVRLMRALAKTLLAFTLALFALPAFAQQEPPARVGRVSIVEGALAFYGPGDNEWSAAKVNFPVAEDGWFATHPNSRTEFRVGADSIFLANNTQ